MAVVLEMKVNNATVRFNDAAYAGCSEEEIERRKKQARIICENILLRAELRRRAEEAGTPNQSG